ncbi:MAG: ATP-binding cassette domain-containing protein [Lachnospiraceae bacterium]|nr:ATP-binding cassette domain-containing protein [Lachnospiraceae bacterium]
MNERKPLLSVKDLKKYYPVKNSALFAANRKVVHAVDGVSFDIYEGETLGLVGESGCGKSTVGRQIVGMEKSDAGELFFRGEKLDKAEFKRQRRQLQMIFQDPTASLNPKRRIYDILSDIMVENGICTRSEARDRVRGLLNEVGLPENAAERYPHEFSGGQRQRIAIARAISLSPRLIICDEPVSALDMSIQAQILNLLKKLQEDLGIAYLFIAHGLGSVRYISHRIAVMYLGRIVELASSAELFKKPCHPYSQALISAVPVADPQRRDSKRIITSGEVPSSIDLPEGCAFAARCRFATERCRKEIPELKEVKNGGRDGSGHLCACFNSSHYTRGLSAVREVKEGA